MYLYSGALQEFLMELSPTMLSTSDLRMDQLMCSMPVESHLRTI